MELWWAALALGLASSLHCTVMCGPLVALVSGRTALDKFLYHSGRALVYILMGLLFGFVGRSLILAGVQNHLSVLAGLLVILLVIVPERYYLSAQWSNSLLQMKQRLVQQASTGGYSKRWLYGIANGLIPCPMVYVALTLALSTGGVGEGMGLMALFGLGTIPLLVFSAHVVSSLPKLPILVRLKPALVVMLGVWLLIRGSNFDIPYLAKPLGWSTSSTTDPSVCK
jgi:hypothetical protein